MRAPDYVTYPPETDRDRMTWYQFFADLASSIPQNGSVAPENNIKANKSCLYTQTASGTSTLWFNTVGNGSSTGWVAK